MAEPEAPELLPEERVNRVVNSGHTRNIPLEDEPGHRLVGFVVPAEIAGLYEGIEVLTRLRDAWNRRDALVSPAVAAPRVLPPRPRPPLVWDGDTEPDGFDARQNLADIIANPSTPTADELVQAQAALARMDAREAAVPIASAEPVEPGAIQTESMAELLLVSFISRLANGADIRAAASLAMDDYWPDDESAALPIASAGEAGWPDKTVAQIWDERDRLRAELDEARVILASTDIGSLPNDYPLSRMAQDRMERIRDLTLQGLAEIGRVEAAVSALASMREALMAIAEVRRGGLQGIREDYPDEAEYNLHAMHFWAREAERIRSIARAALKEGTPSQDTTK